MKPHLAIFAGPFLKFHVTLGTGAMVQEPRAVYSCMQGRLTPATNWPVQIVATLSDLHALRS